MTDNLDWGGNTKPKVKYRIWNWNKDYWYCDMLPGNIKKIIEYDSYNQAMNRVSTDNVTGAEIWKLEGAPMVAMQRLTEPPRDLPV